MESGGKRKYLVFFCKLLAGTIKGTFPITKKPQRFRGGFRGFRQVGRYRPPDKISKRQARAHPWSCPGRGLFLKGFSAPRRPRPRLPAFLEPWKHVFFQKKKHVFLHVFENPFCMVFPYKMPKKIHIFAPEKYTFLVVEKNNFLVFVKSGRFITSEKWTEFAGRLRNWMVVENCRFKLSLIRWPIATHLAEPPEPRFFFLWKKKLFLWNFKNQNQKH